MTITKIQNYIDGEWVDSDTAVYGDVRCPANGQQIATVPYGTRQDVDAAVAAAKAAFDEWRETPPMSRARYLFQIKEAFEENFEEIAMTLTRE
ncbi:MAG: aldehyde dehydrogenase family protein, partial [Deltaproteobacteria bacterium]|nr:aldehyde dehydrogenase family protein [Deltaproteobacteria bacterium]